MICLHLSLFFRFGQKGDFYKPLQSSKSLEKSSGFFYSVKNYVSLFSIVFEFKPVKVVVPKWIFVMETFFFFKSNVTVCLVTDPCTHTQPGKIGTR